MSRHCSGDDTLAVFSGDFFQRYVHNGHRKQKNEQSVAHIYVTYVERIFKNVRLYVNVTE